jgi:hypothetical protein
MKRYHILRSLTLKNSVTLKHGAKHWLLFNKLAPLKHPFTQVSVGKMSAVDSNVDKSLEDDHSLTLDKEAVWSQCHKTFFFVIFWLARDKHSSLFDLFVNN